MESESLRGGAAKYECAVYLLAAGLYLLFHALVAAIGGTPMSTGDLAGPDSYMRLVRVAELYQGGGWYDGTIGRSNAPYGDVLHWTRPFDVLLLAGAWALGALIGFEAALFRWGSLVSPLLHVAVGLAAVWATGPFLDAWRRCLLILAVLAQPGILAYAFAGRADHHMLIVLVFLLSLGAMIRLVLRPFARRSALAAGALTGFGLWLSVEFLLTLIAVFGALGLTWLLRGGDRARKNLWYAIGLAAVVALALVLEWPPADLLTVAYDRISLVQLTIAFLAIGIWGAADRLERGRASTVRARLALAGLAAPAALAVLYLLHPGLFQSAEAHVDPRLVPILLDAVAETQPLIPSDRESFGRFVTFLGPALLTLPFLAYLLVWERREPEHQAWLCVAVASIIFLPLALSVARFVSFADILLMIVLAELLARLLGLIGRIPLFVVKLPLWAATLLVFLFGGVGLGSFVAGGTAVSARGVCDLKAMAAFLARPDGLGARPRVILAEVTFGPELLYRTDHAVVGTPYHRNAQGVSDNHRLFNQPYGNPDRDLIERRGIDLILQCRARDGRYIPVDKADSFYDRLLAGAHPDWLRPLELPAQLADQFRLYAVVR